ncbi:MAG: glycosyltransferase family 39 protein [Kiritimatiellae bacterium]|nr:glycosyltransferase family 39 protein [Kiritimatiellia bacterium]
MNRTIVFAILGSILAAGLALRAWRLTAVEPVNADEAMYLRQARFLHDLGGKAIGLPVPVIDETRTGIWRYVRKADWTEKPCWLHSVFFALVMCVTGVNDLAGVLSNLCFSMATVLVVYVLAKRLAGPAGALAAAGLLAVSFYWLLYSRAHWAEADSVFFVILALHLLLRRCDGARAGWLPAALAGGVAALGVLAHYRWLYVGASLPLCAAVAARPNDRIRVPLACLAGFCLVLGAAALALRLVYVLLRVDIPFSGLFGALYERYFPGPGGMEKQTGFQPLNAVAYLYYFVRNQGWCAALLCGAGALPFFRRRERRRLLAGAALFVLLHLAVLSMQIWVVARPASLIIPVVCVFAGQGTAALLALAGQGGALRRRLVTALAVCLVVGAVAENVGKDLPFIHNAYGYRETLLSLAKQEPGRVLAAEETWAVCGWYSPELRCEPLDSARPSEAGAESSDTYAIFDAQKYHYYPASAAQVSRLEQTVRQHASRVSSVPHLTTAWREFLLEGTQTHSLNGMLASIRNANAEDITAIRVYRLAAR